MSVTTGTAQPHNLVFYLTSLVADGSAGRWFLGGSFTRPEGPKREVITKGRHFL